MMADELGQALRQEADKTAVRAVVLVCLVLVVPLRLWGLALAPGLSIYRLFPVWLQSAIVAVFVGQAIQALRGGALRIVTAAALAASLATAAVQGQADFRAGAWLWWCCMAGVQGYTYWRIVAGGGR